MRPLVSTLAFMIPHPQLATRPKEETTYVNGSRAHAARLPGTDERALPEELLGVVRVGEAGEGALGVVDLVEALVREQDRLVVGAEQDGGERPLAKRHGPPLHHQRRLDARRDLRRRHRLPLREQVRQESGRAAGGR